MKNILRMLIIALVFSSVCAYAEDSFTWRKVDNNAFAVGEYLRFVIRWGLIRGGFSTMEVDSIVAVGDREAYMLVSTARTNGFFDAFFKVRDVNKSWIDTESLCAHKFYKDIHEGKYRKKRMIEYDHKAGKSIEYKDGKMYRELEIPPFVLDVLGALYFTRTQKLDVGQTFSIEVNTGKKNWPLIVKVYRREKIKVPVGSFDCLVVEPHLAGEGIFETKGNIMIWMTDDERHMPVKMKTKVKVGSITAELISTDKKDGTANGFEEE